MDGEKRRDFRRVNMKMNEKTKDILEWVYCIIIAFVLALLIKYFIGTPTVVQMQSMDPTLKQDQRLILSRIGRTFHQMPERGDIITFEAPNVNVSIIDESNPVATYDYEPKGLWKKFQYYVLEVGKKSFIKRVIGLPGDHIEIKDGKVYRNSEELQEDYLQPGVVTTSNAYQDFIVPENYVFAMGDNREHSTDCRDFGCIPLEKIEGTVILRIWPLNKFGFVQ